MVACLADDPPTTVKPESMERLDGPSATAPTMAHGSQIGRSSITEKTCATATLGRMPTSEDFTSNQTSLRAREARRFRWRHCRGHHRIPFVPLPSGGLRPVRLPAPRRRRSPLPTHQPYWLDQLRQPVKEIGLLEVLFRNAARFAAVSGVVAVLVWLTWVMLDVSHMQSGFTLPY